MARYIDGIPMSEAEIRAQRGIKFSPTVSRGDRAKIRRALRSSFSQSELEQISGDNALYIEVAPVDKSHSGSYQARAGRRPAKIVLETPTPDTITHEVVHHLRKIDPSRTGVAKARPTPRDPKRYRDVNNVEEAATVAEAAARTTRPAKTPSGYYDDIPSVKSGKTTRRSAYSHDRKILTNGRPNGNKHAVTAVNERFHSTNISRKKLGNIMAINSWKNMMKPSEKTNKK